MPHNSCYQGSGICLSLVIARVWGSAQNGLASFKALYGVASALPDLCSNPKIWDP